MNKELMNKIYKDYWLSKDDIHSHQHYTIINRQGIEKIQAKAGIKIKYEVVKCESDFACVKALASMPYILVNVDSITIEWSTKTTRTNIETFWSAKHWTFKTWNTTTWYVMEMAEKRAMSRAVLKLTWLYSEGVFGEDESESFKQKPMTEQEKLDKDIESILS